MQVEIERTKSDRMCDMYTITFFPVRTRFVCFTKKEWAEVFPDIVLQRGEKKEMSLQLSDLTSGGSPV